MPIKVEVRDVLILLGPESGATNETLLQIRSWSKKKAALTKIDQLARERMRARRPSSDDAEDASGAPAGWKEKLVKKIIANMRVDIHNVHIRYKDGESDPLHPFAFGITISALQVHTTDACWEETFDDAETPNAAIHKQVRLLGLAIYLDTDVQPPRTADGSAVDLRRCAVERARQYLSTDGVDDEQRRKRSLVVGDAQIPPLIERHSFLLRPVHATCRIRMAGTPTAAERESALGGGLPALSVEIDVKEVALRLSDAQLRDTWAILRSLDEYSGQVQRFGACQARGERWALRRAGAARWSATPASEQRARILLGVCAGLWRGHYFDHPSRRSIAYVGERHAQRLRYAALWVRFAQSHGGDLPAARDAAAYHGGNAMKSKAAAELAARTVSATAEFTGRRRRHNRDAPLVRDEVGAAMSDPLSPAELDALRDLHLRLPIEDIQAFRLFAASTRHQRGGRRGEIVAPHQSRACLFAKQLRAVLAAAPLLPLARRASLSSATVLLAYRAGAAGSDATIARTLGMHPPVIKTLRSIWNEVCADGDHIVSRGGDGRPSSDMVEAVRRALESLAPLPAAGEDGFSAAVQMVSSSIAEQRWVRQDVAAVLSRHERMRRRGRSVNIVVTIDDQWRRGRLRFIELDEYDSGVLEGAELRGFAKEMLSALDLPGGPLAVAQVQTEVETLMRKHEAIGTAAFGRYFVSRARELGREREGIAAGGGDAVPNADELTALPFPAFAAVVLEALGWAVRRRRLRAASEEVRVAEEQAVAAAAAGAASGEGERAEAEGVEGRDDEATPQRGWLEGGIAWLAGWDAEGVDAHAPAELSTQVWEELAGSVSDFDSGDFSIFSSLDSNRILKEFTMKIGQGSYAMACVIGSSHTAASAAAGRGGSAGSTGSRASSQGQQANYHQLLKAAPPQREGVFIEGAFKGLDLRRCERSAGSSTSSTRLANLFVDCHLGDSALSRTLRVTAPPSLTSSELLRIMERCGQVAIAQMFRDGKGKVTFKGTAAVSEALRMARQGVLRTATPCRLTGLDMISVAQMESNAFAQHWVQVTGLPRPITATQIEAHMSRIGAVAAVQLKEGDESASVRYWREDDARRAVEAHPYGLTRSKIVIATASGSSGDRKSRTTGRRGSAAKKQGNPRDGFIIVQPIRTVMQLVGRRRLEVRGASGGEGAGGSGAGAGARRTLQSHASVDELGGADPLLYVSVDVNPPFPAADLALRVATAALELVYNPQIMDTVSRFFQAVPEDQVALAKSLSSSAKEYTKEMRARVERKLGEEGIRLREAELVDKATGKGDSEAKTAPRKAIDLDIRMRAPIVLIPEDPRCVHPEMLLLVLDLGTLEVGTVLLSHRDSKPPSARSDFAEASGVGGAGGAFSPIHPAPPPSPASSNIGQLLDAPRQLSTVDMLLGDPRSIPMPSALRAPRPAVERNRLNVDRYSVQVTGIQVITTSLANQWRDPSVQQRLALRLVQNFDIGVNFSMLARPHLSETMWMRHATIEMRGLDVTISDKTFASLIRLQTVITHSSEEALRSAAALRVAEAYKKVAPKIAREVQRPSRESMQRARDVLMAKLEATRAKMHHLGGGGIDRISPTDSIISGSSRGSRGGGRGSPPPLLDDVRSISSGRSRSSRRSRRDRTASRGESLTRQSSDLYSFATASSSDEEETDLSHRRGGDSTSESPLNGEYSGERRSGSGSGTPINSHDTDDFPGEEEEFFDCTDESDGFSEGDGELLDTQGEIMEDLELRISFVEGELVEIAAGAFPKETVAAVDLTQRLEDELMSVQDEPPSSMAWAATASKLDRVRALERKVERVQRLDDTLMGLRREQQECSDVIGTWKSLLLPRASGRSRSRSRNSTPYSVRSRSGSISRSVRSGRSQRSMRSTGRSIRSGRSAHSGRSQRSVRTTNTSFRLSPSGSANPWERGRGGGGGRRGKARRAREQENESAVVVRELKATVKMSNTSIRFTHHCEVIDGLATRVEGEPILTLWVDEISVGIERERRGNSASKAAVDEKYQFDLQQIKITDDTVMVEHGPSNGGSGSGASSPKDQSRVLVVTRELDHTRILVSVEMRKRGTNVPHIDFNFSALDVYVRQPVLATMFALMKVDSGVSKAKESKGIPKATRSSSSSSSSSAAAAAAAASRPSSTSFIGSVAMVPLKLQGRISLRNVSVILVNESHQAFARFSIDDLAVDEFTLSSENTLVSVEGKLGIMQVKDLKSDSEDASINRRMQNRNRASSLFSKAQGGAGNPGEFHISGTTFALSPSKVKIKCESIQLVVIANFVQRLVNFATLGPMKAALAQKEKVKSGRARALCGPGSTLMEEEEAKEMATSASTAAAATVAAAAAARGDTSEEKQSSTSRDFSFESKTIEVYLPDSAFDAAASKVRSSGAELLVSVDTLYIAKTGIGAPNSTAPPSDDPSLTFVESKTSMGVDQLQIFATRPSRTHARLLKVEWHRGGRRPNFGSMKQAIAFQIEERHMPAQTVRFVTTSQIDIQQVEAHVRLVSGADGDSDAASSPMLRSEVAVASVAGMRTTLSERHVRSLGRKAKEVETCVSLFSGRMALETLKQNQLQWQQWQHEDGGATLRRGAQQRRFGSFAARTGSSSKQQARSTVFQINQSPSLGGGAGSGGREGSTTASPTQRIAVEFDVPVKSTKYATIGLLEAHVGVADCELLVRVCTRNLLPAVEHLRKLSSQTSDDATRHHHSPLSPRPPSIGLLTDIGFESDREQAYRDLTKDLDELELGADCALLTLKRDASGDEVRFKVGAVCAVASLAPFASIVETVGAILNVTKTAELNVGGGSTLSNSVARSPLGGGKGDTTVTITASLPAAAPLAAKIRTLDAQVVFEQLEIHICDRVRPPPVAYSSVGFFSAVQFSVLRRGVIQLAGATPGSAATLAQSRIGVQLTRVRSELRHATSAMKMLKQAECRIILLEPCVVQAMVDINAPGAFTRSAESSETEMSLDAASTKRSISTSVVLSRPTVSDADAAERSVTARLPIQQLQVLNAMIGVMGEVVRAPKAAQSAELQRRVREKKAVTASAKAAVSSASSSPSSASRSASNALATDLFLFDVSVPSFGLVVEDEARISARTSSSTLNTAMFVWRIDSLRASGTFRTPTLSAGGVNDAWGHAGLNVGTQLLGFNRHLERWEPLVEPWQITVDLDKTVLRGTSCVSVHVDTTNVLNLNVTPNLLSNLERARAAIGEAPHLFETMGHGDDAVARYRVANSSSASFVYRLAPVIASTGMRRTWTLTASGTEESLDVPRTLALTEHIDMIQCKAATETALRPGHDGREQLGFVRLRRSVREESRASPLMWLPCTVRTSALHSGDADGDAQPTSEQGEGTAAHSSSPASPPRSPQATSVEIEVDAARFSSVWLARPWWADVASSVGATRALTSIDLSATGMTDHECALLGESLKQESEYAVVAVDLSRNDITDIGCWYIGDALRANRHVVSVNVDGNAAVDELRLAIASAALQSAGMGSGATKSGGVRDRSGGVNQRRLSPVFDAGRSASLASSLRRSKSADQLSQSSASGSGGGGAGGRVRGEPEPARSAAWPIVGAGGPQLDSAPKSTAGWQHLQEALVENQEKARDVGALSSMGVSAMAPAARCATLSLVCAAGRAAPDAEEPLRKGRAVIELPLPELMQWLSEGVLLQALPTFHVSAAFTKLGIQEFANLSLAAGTSSSASTSTSSGRESGGESMDRAMRRGANLITDVDLEGNAKVLLLRSKVALSNRTPLDLVVRLTYTTRNGSSALRTQVLSAGARSFIPIDVAHRLTGMALCEHIGVTVSGSMHCGGGDFMGSYIRCTGVVGGRPNSVFYCKTTTEDTLTTLAAKAEADAERERAARSNGGRKKSAQIKPLRDASRVCIYRERRSSRFCWCIRVVSISFAVTAATREVVPTLHHNDHLRPDLADVDFESEDVSEDEKSAADMSGWCESSAWWKSHTWAAASVTSVHADERGYSYSVLYADGMTEAAVPEDRLRGKEITPDDPPNTPLSPRPLVDALEAIAERRVMPLFSVGGKVDVHRELREWLHFTNWCPTAWGAPVNALLGQRVGTLLEQSEHTNTYQSLCLRPRPLLASLVPDAPPEEESSSDEEEEELRWPWSLIQAEKSVNTKASRSSSAKRKVCHRAAPPPTPSLTMGLKCDRERKCIEMTFKPPIVVENCLPCALEYALLRSSNWAHGGVISRSKEGTDADAPFSVGLIEAGQHLETIVSGWWSVMYLSVRMVGYAWSDPVQLGSDLEIDGVPWASVLSKFAGGSPPHYTNSNPSVYSRTLHVCDELGLELELGMDVGMSWNHRLDDAGSEGDDVAEGEARSGGLLHVGGGRGVGASGGEHLSMLDRPDGTLCVSIYAPICISNESGQPIIFSHLAPTWWSRTFAAESEKSDVDSTTRAPTRELLCEKRAIAAGQAASLQAIERAEESELALHADGSGLANCEGNMRGRSRKNITDAPPVRGLFDIIDWETDALSGNGTQPTTPHGVSTSPSTASSISSTGVGAKKENGSRRGSDSGVAGGGMSSTILTSSSQASENLLPLHYSDSKKRAATVLMRVASSSWSKPFAIAEDSTATLVVTVHESANISSGRKWIFGVAVERCLPPFQRTLRVTIAPRYVLVNGLPRALSFKQHGVSSEASGAATLGTQGQGVWRDNSGLRSGCEGPTSLVRQRGAVVTLAPGESIPFHWAAADAPYRLQACFDEFGWIWSGGLPLDPPIDSLDNNGALMLRNALTGESSIVGTELRPSPRKASLLWVFRPADPTVPPYRIVNNTLYTLRYAQEEKVGARLGDENNNGEVLLPYARRSYTWDQPTGPKRLVVELIHSGAYALGLTHSMKSHRDAASVAFRLKQQRKRLKAGARKSDNFEAAVGAEPLLVGSFALDQIANERPLIPGVGLGVQVVTEGPVRVLRFFEVKPVSPLQHRVPRGGGSGLDLVQHRGSGERTGAEVNGIGDRRFGGYTFATEAEATPVLFAFDVNLLGAGISVVDHTPCEIVYLSAHSAKLHLTVKSASRQWKFQVERMQIDNQLFSTDLPVLMRPAPHAGKATGRREKSRRIDGHAGSSRKAFIDIALAEDLRFAGVRFIRTLLVEVQPVEFNVDAAVVTQLKRFRDHMASASESSLKLPSHQHQHTVTVVAGRMVSTGRSSHMASSTTLLPSALAAARDIVESAPSLSSRMSTAQSQCYFESICIRPVDVTFSMHMLFDIVDAKITLREFARPPVFTTPSALVEALQAQ